MYDIYCWTGVIGLSLDVTVTALITEHYLPAWNGGHMSNDLYMCYVDIVLCNWDISYHVLNICIIIFSSRTQILEFSTCSSATHSIFLY